PAQIGVVLAQVAVRGGVTGLVVDDVQRPAVVEIHAVGLATEVHGTAVGQAQLDGAERGTWEPEGQLRGDRSGAVERALLAVDPQESMEVGEQPTLVALPEHAPTGQSPILVLVTQ